MRKETMKTQGNIGFPAHRSFKIISEKGFGGKGSGSYIIIEEKGEDEKVYHWGLLLANLTKNIIQALQLSEYASSLKSLSPIWHMQEGRWELLFLVITADEVRNDNKRGMQITHKADPTTVYHLPVQFVHLTLT